MGSDVDAVWAVLPDPAKHVVVQEAPAIRASLIDEFGMPPGTLVTGKDLHSLDITPVRGLDGVKEATVLVGPFGDIKIAVAHGLGNARKIMDLIRDKKADLVSKNENGPGRADRSGPTCLNALKARS